MAALVGVPAQATRESTVSGVLQDEQGRPLSGTRILACMSTVCLTETTEADGRFTFTIEAPASIAIKTTPDPDATPRRAAALRPVRLDAGRSIDLGAVHVPTLPAGAPLPEQGGADSQMVRAGDGLVLGVQRSALKAAPGEVVIDLAARRLSARVASTYPALAGERVLAVYALHPFGATSNMPIAIQAPVDVADGTAVSFRTISEIDGTFSDRTPGQVAAGIASTAPAAGIRHLTYLVISAARDR